MLRRVSLMAIGSVLLLTSCAPSTPVLTQPRAPSVTYQVQQDDTEGADDASLDALIRQLDSGSDAQPATPSATPAQTQRIGGLQVQQGSWGGGGGWYGGFGYGIFARCQRVFRRCINNRISYGGYGTYQLCRRIRNRCIRSQWWR